MRLIDADELKHGLCVECTLYPDNCLKEDCDWNSIFHIEHAPTIKAVPLENYRSMEQTVYKLTQALAEAEPIKHGRWQIGDAYPHNIYCSKCHKRFAQLQWAVWEDGSLPRNYCPNCGARMDGDHE